ncbi:MAG: hypothetical protein ACREIP_14565, partial [Alphaproteobacteria bacterium]
YAPLEREVSELMKPRRYSAATPVGKYLIGFSDHWTAFDDARLAGRVKLKLSPPFASTEWQQHLRLRGQDYLAEAFRRVGLAPESRIALYVLGWMGPNGLFDDPNLYPILFDESLDAMADACPALPIFVKPHPAMHVHEREALFERLRRRGRGLIVASDLHPMVLGQRACFAISNCYSTTFSMLRAMDVPTIEYTAYKARILEATAGGSLRPEFVTHFVQRDPAALRRVLCTLSTRPGAVRTDTTKRSVSEPLLALL